MKFEERLSENFTLSEFLRSPTAGRHSIDEQWQINEEIYRNISALVKNVLQPARDKFQRPISINSGYRCYRVNRLVGGSENSDHLTGRAADIPCYGDYTLLEILKKLDFDQLIYYYDDRVDFLHVSYRETGNRNEILECYLEADERGVERRYFREVK
jgi:hypothetical protein